MSEPSRDNERNYWPYAITGMILTVVVLGIWTVRIAVKNPVQESNAYMMKYQDVDANINEILAKKRAFDRQYTMDLSANRLHLGPNNRVVVKILTADGRPAEGIGITAIVQRPTTNRENIELRKFTYQNGEYVSDPFAIEKPGRWNIQVRAEAGGAVGYETWKTFIKVP